LHLLEAIRKQNRECRVIVFGSSAEYGKSSAQNEYIAETATLEPDTPYGVSKVAADLMAEVYGRAYSMNVIRVRPFLVIGPGFAWNVFVDFAQRIAKIEKGASDDFGVGNLDAVRDLTDVRDAVRAVWVIAENGEPGAVYNLCNSRAYTIREGLDVMLKFASSPVRLFTDTSKFRKLDTPRLVGDNSRLRHLGWSPEIPLERTLEDILDFWRVQSQTSSALVPAQ
jgi:GDP-4-dehydro-6-deoxy-D-mannose reductase